ncbi:MAG: glycosyltransferase, partial [Pseudomonadota bacterium]
PGKELFVAGDEAQFVNQAVQLVMENESEDMGKAARERILADYGWPESLARIDQLLIPASEAI